MNYFQKITFVISFLFCTLSVYAQHHQHKIQVTGKIISTDEKEAVAFATVYLKGTSYGTTTNNNGIYNFEAPSGHYTLVVSAIGYKTVEKPVKIAPEQENRFDTHIASEITQLNEVVVLANGVTRIKESPYNAVAVDARSLQNTTKTLSEALAQLPGMKLRESGGVGSDTQIMLDGFSGKYVKVFIDGVPQEGVGHSFSINNIPINFAERIEVYKGVTPVGFGTDALGGVINIVTHKNRREWFLDTSYSFGSFNTHKSYINFGQTLKNGFMYEVNAFQNYSDNDYHIHTYVTQFHDNGTTTTDENKIERVKRFNDTYHNEAIAGKIGLVDKKFADRLVLGFTYANVYKEIQTGVRQEIVFGGKHRKGHSFMPSLEYRKRNFFTEGLDVNLTINYNHNLTQNTDTVSYKYNWYGERKYTGSPGEQSHQDNESKNVNWNGTFRATYRLGDKHVLTLNHVLTAQKRNSRSYVNSKSLLSDFSIPKETRKNIGGLSYRFTPAEKWNLSVFGKYYNQYSAGPVSLSLDGIGSYEKRNKKVSTLGYGAAGAYFILRDLQVKTSYERAYRLPSTDELFGDEDLEAGKVNLKPERSDNLNLNVNYTRRFDKHMFYVEGSLIYRDTKDYIRRGISKYGSTYYGSYENHGNVETKGYNLSLRYTYSHWFSLGGTYNSMDVRDREKYLAKETLQTNLHYNARIPNQPYCFANLDASFYLHDLFVEGNVLSVTYDSYYQLEFPLNWENIGDPSTKKRVPEQFSHNMGLTYSLKNGRYNLSFECKNLTDEALYDNYSLQKAGRAFYGKVRVYFGH
ncbi:MAG: carboxypeptidase-like regulatory domain-containing protein [Mediterranea sp.]|nr:carboxypeptidase-like regulatory domain-containing protein [Mediterranea sp.]